MTSGRRGNPYSRFFTSSFARYLLVGVGTSLLDFTLFNALSVALRVPVIPSNVVSTIVTVCVSYLINRAFVFRAERPTWSSFFSFAGLTLLTGLVLQSAIISGTLEGIGLFRPGLDSKISHPIAKAVAMGLAAACNFLGYRWIFSKTGAPSQAVEDSSDFSTA